MKTKLGSEPAFPVVMPSGSETADPGLTKRELFAAMAMCGLLAYPENEPCMEELPSVALKHADNLLAELEKETHE